jgi:chromosome segregation ATPase
MGKVSDSRIVTTTFAEVIKIAEYGITKLDRKYEAKSIEVHAAKATLQKEKIRLQHIESLLSNLRLQRTSLAHQLIVDASNYSVQEEYRQHLLGREIEIQELCLRAAHDLNSRQDELQSISGELNRAKGKRDEVAKRRSKARSVLTNFELEMQTEEFNETRRI